MDRRQVTEWARRLGEQDAKFEVARRLEAASYKFAKTMAENPHWYTLRKSWVSMREFAETAAAVQMYGEHQWFQGRRYTQLALNGYTYWTMGASPIDTELVNRKRMRYQSPYDEVADDYDRRIQAREPTDYRDRWRRPLSPAEIEAQARRDAENWVLGNLGDRIRLKPPSDLTCRECGQENALPGDELGQECRTAADSPWCPAMPPNNPRPCRLVLGSCTRCGSRRENPAEGAHRRDSRRHICTFVPGQPRCTFCGRSSDPLSRTFETNGFTRSSTDPSFDVERLIQKLLDERGAL